MLSGKELVGDEVTLLRGIVGKLVEKRRKKERRRKGVVREEIGEWKRTLRRWEWERERNKTIWRRVVELLKLGFTNEACARIGGCSVTKIKYVRRVEGIRKVGIKEARENVRRKIWEVYERLGRDLHGTAAWFGMKVGEVAVMVEGVEKEMGVGSTVEEAWERRWRVGRSWSKEERFRRTREVLEREEGEDGKLDGS